MATVLSQWIYSLGESTFPLPSDTRNSVNLITDKLSRFAQTQNGNTLSEIIDQLYAMLSTIGDLTISKPDNQGNIIATIGSDVRIALALGITNIHANNISLFGRKEWEKHFDANGNSNPNHDLIVAAKAILSKWSTIQKAGESYLEQSLWHINFTGEFAHEETDGQWDARHVIMPVFHAETVGDYTPPTDKPIQVVSTQEFTKMNPTSLTAKARAYQRYIQAIIGN